MSWWMRCLGAAALLFCVGGVNAASDPVAVLINLLDEAEVPAREAGVLLAIEAKEGARVQEGAVLARIDDTEARFLQQRAKLEMEVAARNAANENAILAAQKTWDVAKTIFERSQEAAQKFRNSVPQTELDRLRLDAEKAELALRQAQHEREVARVTQQLKQTEYEFATSRLERRRIVAPFSGVVVEVYQRRGEWVEPDTRVLRLVRLDRLRAEGFLPARQAVAELLGRPVTVTVTAAESPAAAFHGTIVFVSPEVDPVNDQVRVLAEIDNPQLTLRPGVRGVLTIAGPAVKQ